MGHRILIAEKDRVLRVVIKKALKNLGFEFCEVDWLEGVNKTITEFKPNLVIIDLSGKVEWGLRWAEKLRDDSSTKKLKVMAVVDDIDRESLTYLIKLSVRKILTKPFNERDLKEKVMKVLKLESEVPMNSGQ